MNLNWNFLGGGGEQKIFHGGVWIFSGTAQFFISEENAK